MCWEVKYISLLKHAAKLLIQFIIFYVSESVSKKNPELPYI